jgi:TRAP-type transport system periplasmic protein
MKLHYPTDDELAQFKEVSQPIYDKYKDVWGEDLLKAFQN